MVGAHFLSYNEQKKPKKPKKSYNEQKKKRKERKNAYGQGTFFVNENNIIRPGSPGEPKLNQFLSHNSRTTTTV